MKRFNVNDYKTSNGAAVEAEVPSYTPFFSGQASGAQVHGLGGPWRSELCWVYQRGSGSSAVWSPGTNQVVQPYSRCDDPLQDQTLIATQPLVHGRKAS